MVRLSKFLVDTLFGYVRKSVVDLSFKPKSVPDGLKDEFGVFVTFTIGGLLRGCIGFINPRPLWASVIDASRASAFNDSRFSPMSDSELDNAVVELSILSKPKGTVLSSVKRGDGLIISKGVRSALFLPQVWDELPKKSDFIRQLFLKAGLNPMATGVSYSKFTVAAYKKCFAKC